jgi:hypothetical protein
MTDSFASVYLIAAGGSLYPDVQGLDAIDVLGAAQMQYRKYVSLLRQPNGHTNGTIAMMIPSRGAHITTYQAS